MGLTRKKLIELVQSERFCSELFAQLADGTLSEKQVMDKVRRLYLNLFITIIGIVVIVMGAYIGQAPVLIAGVFVLSVGAPDLFIGWLYMFRIYQLGDLLEEEGQKESLLSKDYYFIKAVCEQIMRCKGRHLVTIAGECGEAHNCTRMVRRKFRRDHNVLTCFNLVDSDREIYTDRNGEMNVVHGFHRKWQR